MIETNLDLHQKYRNVLSVTGDSTTQELIKNFTAMWDIGNDNFIPKNLFQEFYYRYFKNAEDKDLEKILGIKGDELKDFRRQLSDNETIFFSGYSPFEISHFLLSRISGGKLTIAMKVDSDGDVLDPQGLFNEALDGLESYLYKPRKHPGLDYYDNRRDFDG